MGPAVLRIAGFAAVLAFLLSTLFSAVSAPEIRFQDVASEAGIRARMRCGGLEKRWIPEANGSGAAWLDYDHDGLLDLLVVNGSTMDDLRDIVHGKRPVAREGSVYLYHNLGKGRFGEVARKAGLTNPYWGTGAAVGDFNNDGYPDILVTNIGVDLLFRNNRDGTFQEVGADAGLSRKVAWHTGAAFGDFDGDGHPDLYVAGYVALSALNFDADPPVCSYRSVRGFCGPKGLAGEPDILYRNLTGEKFADITEEAHVTDKNLSHGFTVVVDDFNGDGRLDIFVANDSDPNYLYFNQGNGTFAETGLSAGVAFNGDGQSQANMGVAVGDFDNNGLLDILTTTFSEDYFPLFRQHSPGQFDDVSAPAGIAAGTMPWVGWACGMADLDNDGNKDIWVANGHVYPNAGALGSTSYFQPFAVFANRGGGFIRTPVLSASGDKNSWRGGCQGDFNNDGRIDVLILPVSGSPLLLQNKTESIGHWIGLDLQARHNRDFSGTRIRIESCGKAQFDVVRNGGSYLSHDDSRIHFGLGMCRSVDTIEITWPGGRKQTLRKLSADRYLRIEEPL